MNSPNTQILETAPAVGVPRLVLPRRESLAWLKLARHLNEIGNAAEHATYRGFVKRNATRLDYELERLIQNATSARELLRQNA
jgi:hypothetical protein